MLQDEEKRRDMTDKAAHIQEVVFGFDKHCVNDANFTDFVTANSVLSISVFALFKHDLDLGFTLRDTIIRPLHI